VDGREREGEAVVAERMKWIRCKKCRRKLFKGEIKEIEIKCPKCGYVQILNGSKEKTVDILYKKNNTIQDIERFDRQ